MRAIILPIFFVLVTSGYASDKMSGEISKSPTEIAIQLESHELVVEIANSPLLRQRGLMFRRLLQDDHGMLFIFEESGLHGFWMKNTYIPLDIGFFDENRVLIEVHSMEPHSLEVTRVSKNAKYALEIAQGWFKKNKIEPGSKFVFK